MKQSESLSEGISYIVTTRTIKAKDGTVHISKEITPLIRCIDCHHFAISVTLERADGTIKPVRYICRLRRVPVREDEFCSMAIKRPEEWKRYE